MTGVPPSNLRYDQRPVDGTPVHTGDLPATPTRDRNIPARAWVEAPRELLLLGHGLPGEPDADYKRRIGPWLLWRAGPATKARARYFACLASDPDTSFTFHLSSDGTGEGTGPSGALHRSFRSWKEDLRDNAPAA